MATIGQCLRAYGLHEELLSHATRVGFEQWQAWDADCVCGEACLDMSDRARRLMETMDPLAIPKLWEALITAMNVICNG